MVRIAPCLMLLLAIASPSALADSWHASWNHSRGYDHFDSWRGGRASGYRWNNHWGGGYPYRGNYVSVGFGDWGGYSPYRFNRHYSRSARHYNRGYNRGFRHGSRWGHGGHRNNDAAVLLGGVVLGSLLTNSVSQQQTRYQPVPVVSRRVVSSSPVRAVVRESTPRRVVTQESSRRSPYLLRDLQGDCFEVERDAQGNELRTQVDPQHCEF